MNPSLILGGLKSWMPLPERAYVGTGGTTSARYCYSVWLRHLSLLHRAELPTRASRVVEIGPGDSIGTGLAALLSGSDEYIGLDVVPHADVPGDLRVFDEILTLFGDRAAIPGPADFPRLYPSLEEYGFPAEFLTPERMSASLEAGRVSRLRDAVSRSHTAPSGEPIRYLCPWSPTSVEAGTADLVMSQGALQDMDHSAGRDALGATLAATAQWLRPGAATSHQIDFSCPAGEVWNHHWEFSERAWRVVLGRRPYYFNRVPLSGYLDLFERNGLAVRAVHPLVGKDSLAPEKLAREFQSLPASDYRTRAAFIIAVKR